MKKIYFISLIVLGSMLIIDLTVSIQIIRTLLIIISFFTFFYTVKNLMLGKPKQMYTLEIGDKVFIMCHSSCKDFKKSNYPNRYFYLVRINSGEVMLYESYDLYDEKESNFWAWNGIELKPKE